MFSLCPWALCFHCTTKNSQAQSPLLLPSRCWCTLKFHLEPFLGAPSSLILPLDVRHPNPLNFSGPSLESHPLSTEAPKGGHSSGCVSPVLSRALAELCQQNHSPGASQGVQELTPCCPGDTELAAEAGSLHSVSSQSSGHCPAAQKSFHPLFQQE